MRNQHVSSDHDDNNTSHEEWREGGRGGEGRGGEGSLV